MFELIAEPLSYFVDPSKRIYWGYALTAVIAASLVTTAMQGQFNWQRQLGALCNWRYWFNASTAVDYLLMLVNSVLKTLLVIPVLGAHLAGALTVAACLQSNFHDIEVTFIPWFGIAVLFSVTLFVVDDLSRFLLHRAMHQVPWLWSLHKVHHSATVLTPFTVFRIHPIESVLYFLRGFVIFACCAGLFIWLFKGKLTALELLGVDALGFLFNMAAANLRHSHVPLSFGRLETLFISPVQHQLHHSTAHQNINFGSCFAIWDRWNNSLTKSSPVELVEQLEFGLNSQLVGDDKLVIRSLASEGLRQV